MTNGKQRKIGAILSYVSIVASTLVGLLYTPFMISKLGQNEYGLYSLVSSVIAYLTVLDLGFGNAIIVYTTKYRENKQFENEKKLHGMFKIVYCLIGIVSGIIGIILFLNVGNMFGSTMNSIELSEMRIMMLILTFNLAITFVFSIYSSIINAYERFVFQKILSILNTILKPIIMIPLLFLGYKSIAMCIAITIINMLVLLSNYYYCKYKLNIKVKYSGFDSNMFKLIMGYSLWIFLGTIVDKINWSVDQFVLGAVSGTIAVSVYAVAAHLNTMFVNLSTAMSSVLLPKVSKMVANNATNEEISNEFIKVGRIQYYIIFLMISGFALFGKEFILAWVGREYLDSYYITLILIVPLFVPLIQNLGVSILQAKNMHKFRSILLTGIAIANIIISIPLAKMYQGIGSAIGTSISLIIGNILIINIYYYKKVKLDIPNFWKNIFYLTIPFVIPITLIFLIMQCIVLTGFTSVIVYGSIYTILYLIVCYYFDFNKYEKGFIDKILKKIHLKRS